MYFVYFRRLGEAAVSPVAPLLSRTNTACFRDATSATHSIAAPQTCLCNASSSEAKDCEAAASCA